MTLNQVWKAPAVGPVCVVMGLTMIAFGIPFVYPNPRALQSTPPYHQMGQLAHYSVYGGLFIVGGSWRVLAALVGSYRQREFSTATAIAVWCFLFLNFLIAAPTSTGVTVFGVWTILETWTLFRIRRSDRFQREALT